MNIEKHYLCCLKIEKYLIVITLEFLISVALRLLILRNFPGATLLFAGGMLINFGQKVFLRRLTLICPIFFLFLIMYSYTLLLSKK